MKSLFLAIVLLVTANLAQAQFHRGRGPIDNRRPTESFRQTCNVVREDYYRIQAYCQSIRGQMLYNDFNRSGCSTDPEKIYPWLGM